MRDISLSASYLEWKRNTSDGSGMVPNVGREKLVCVGDGGVDFIDRVFRRVRSDWSGGSGLGEEVRIIRTCSLIGIPVRPANAGQEPVAGQNRVEGVLLCWPLTLDGEETSSLDLPAIYITRPQPRDESAQSSYPNGKFIWRAD